MIIYIVNIEKFIIGKGYSINKKQKNKLDNIYNSMLLYMLSLIWRGGRVGLWHQSWKLALAILNDNNTGIVLNGIYGRDTSNIYAKPVTEGKSEYALSKEEKEAIERAMK